MPEVSVLTPSFGYGRFIRDALSSVRAQDGVDVEHVVQDAASKDNTVEVLHDFSDEVTWQSEPDRGQSDGLNKAFQRSRGRWIGWLNADEFYLPGALRTLAAEGERAAADVVYGDAVFVDEGGRLIRLFPSHNLSAWVLRGYGPFIGSCTVLFRRSALQESPWDVNVRRIMDWDLYLRLLFRGARFVHIPYPVGAYRIHAEQVTAQPSGDFLQDHRVVRSRYGLPMKGRSAQYALGRSLHAGYKLLGGAYKRQILARRMRGTDLRWFDSDVGRAAADELLNRCYSADLRRAQSGAGDR